MQNTVSDQQDAASDYGSEFTPDEEEILNGLLQAPPAPESSDNPITDSELLLQDIEGNEGPRGIRLPVFLQHALSSSMRVPEVADKRLQVQFDHSTEGSTNVESTSARAEREDSPSIEAPLDPGPLVPDLRSPLERFRTKPKKALSVTDLISPSWCELQYWYVLTKHGRKRRTPAMRQGSKIHKTLEDQLHTTVAVDIKTKEDKWGLRIWNVIQGLRTLKDRGMTRELEIWGLLDGQVVNGVIDELSYICPDRQLEAAAEEKKKAAGKATPVLAPDQATISEFLSPRGTLESSGQGLRTALRSSQLKARIQEPLPRIYISDVKTRGVRSLPKGASFRPTFMQLLLYHRLLADLVTGKVNTHLLFSRYDLNPDVPFTDSFIAQIGNLNQHDGPDQLDNDDFPPQETALSSSQDTMTVLLEHNSLTSLWAFMIEEFKAAFPLGTKSLGQVLKAEYRDANTGDIMGAKTILYEPDTLEEYLSEEMEWWRGERSAKGVGIEEAYKCGSCEFAEGCEWRANKIEEHVGKMRSSSKV